MVVLPIPADSMDFHLHSQFPVMVFLDSVFALVLSLQLPALNSSNHFVAVAAVVVAAVALALHFWLHFRAIVLFGHPLNLLKLADLFDLLNLLLRFYDYRVWPLRLLIESFAVWHHISMRLALLA